MGPGGFGQMRATDADRDGVHSVLQAAYADGRLSWEEFDSRSTALLDAKTYDQLGALTADLRAPVPYQGPQFPLARQVAPTNRVAIASLVFSLMQFPFWFFASIPAIICGHIARQQIKQTGQAGAGLAAIGLGLGYLGLFGPFIALLLFLLAK